MTLIDFLRRGIGIPQRKPTVILLYALFASSLWKYASSPIEGSFLSGETKTILAFILFGLIPAAIVKLVFRENWADYGLKIGDLRSAVRWCGVLLPVFVAVAVSTGNNPTFYDVYPLNETLRPQNRPLGATVLPSLFAVHSLFYLGYYFGWEFLLRGFVQQGLVDSQGPVNAVLIQTVLSTMLHYGNPPSEVFGAALGGLLWGFLVLRTGSIFSGMLQHAVLGIAVDALLVYRC